MLNPLKNKRSVILVILVAFLACEINCKGGRGGGSRGGGSSRGWGGSSRGSSGSRWSIFNWFRSSPKSKSSSSSSSHTNTAPKPSYNSPPRSPDWSTYHNGYSNSRLAPPPYGGPPPPYPGYGSARHSPPDLNPPPYSRFGGQHSHPGPIHNFGQRPSGTYNNRRYGSSPKSGYSPYYRHHNETQWGRSPSNPV